MLAEDCYQLGHISRLHGYKGELIAVFDTDRAEDYYELESIFLDLKGELVPFFIEEMARNPKGHFIIRLEDVDPEEAVSLVGRKIYLPQEILPELEGKQFYYHEIIGFTALDENLGPIGIIEHVIDQTAQPIFLIEKDGKEILIPAVDEIIQEIDRINKVIKLQCPDGLVELYLDA